MLAVSSSATVRMLATRSAYARASAAAGVAVSLGACVAQSCVNPRPATAALLQSVRDYNVNGNEVKAGSTIKWEDRTYLVLGTVVNMRGRAHTTYNLELKDVTSGSRISVKVRPADKVEVIEMQTVRFNYLYRDGNTLFFMDPVSFEQVELDASLTAGRHAGYLLENSSVQLVRNGETFVKIVVPEKVVCTVASTSAPTKQQNDTGGKQAKLTNGITVTVPLWIENGTHIVVNTNDNAYVSKSDVPPAPEVEKTHA